MARDWRQAGEGPGGRRDRGDRLDARHRGTAGRSLARRSGGSPGPTWGQRGSDRLLDLAPGGGVLTLAAHAEVLARTALQDVFARLAVELVVALATLQGVLARTAADQIVAGEAGELVVPTQSDHHVLAGGSDAHVVAARADDGRGLAPAGGWGRKGLRAGSLDGRIGRALVLGHIAEAVAVGIRLDVRRNEDP